MSAFHAQLMLPEFDREMPRTRKVLAAVPRELLSWQAADTMRSIGWNANHLVDIVNWTKPIIEHAEFDMAPPGAAPHETPTLADPDAILDAFDAAVCGARDAISGATDELLGEMWSLKSGGHVLFTITKAECLRTWLFNHTVHHRAILSVYLRLNGIDLTPVYDE